METGKMNFNGTIAAKRYVFPFFHLSLPLFELRQTVIFPFFHFSILEKYELC
jgi:hypothetical protein